MHDSKDWCLACSSSCIWCWQAASTHICSCMWVKGLSLLCTCLIPNQGRRDCACTSWYSSLPNYRQFNDRHFPSDLKAHLRSRAFALHGAEKRGLHKLFDKVH